MRSFLSSEDDTIVTLRMWDPMWTRLSLAVDLESGLDREARGAFDDPVAFSVPLDDCESSFAFLHLLSVPCPVV